MLSDPYRRSNWGEWLLGWLFTLLLLAFAAEALAEQLKPVLPWIALSAIGLVAFAVWLRRRERW